MSQKSNKGFSVYTAEMIEGLQWIEHNRLDKVVICSDSASILNSISSSRSESEDLLMEFYSLLHRVKAKGVVIHFCWVPAQNWGIRERGDG